MKEVLFYTDKELLLYANLTPRIQDEKEAYTQQSASD